MGEKERKIGIVELPFINKYYLYKGRKIPISHFAVLKVNDQGELKFYEPEPEDIEGERRSRLNG